MTNAGPYQAKLESYTQGKEPFAMQSDAPKTISKLFAGVPEQILQQRPSPDKWSAGEIIAHLAEDELVSSWRYRQMIENCGCELAAFNQEEWARLGNYASWKPWDSLLMFRLLREANLRMLHRLSDNEWERFGFHAERGKITVKDLVRHMAGHDLNHIDQIRAIVTKS